MLKQLEYDEFLGNPKQWTLAGLTLGQVNLLVGQNATGKTRCLNILHNLAIQLSGKAKNPLRDCRFRIQLEEEDTSITYVLRYVDGSIAEEMFCRGEETLLQRGEDGKGKMHFQKLNQPVEIELPRGDLAASRRDSIQHPFLEPLHKWADNLRHYLFGSTMGKDHIAIVVPDSRARSDAADVNRVIGFYRRACKEFPDTFKHTVMEEMQRVGYAISDIGTKAPSDIEFSPPPPGEPTILYVHERDLETKTEQFSMSAGMFRALSIIIHINYTLRLENPSCILIDDIGEGLDFGRSKELITLLIEKVQATDAQLIMSSNDRFVMNAVPLQYWSVLSRQGGDVTVRNWDNSRKLFEDFQLTGLNNFDFLASGFADRETANAE